MFSKKCRISKLLLIFRMFEPLYERFYDAKIDDLGIILIFQTTVIVVFGCTSSGPRILTQFGDNKQSWYTEQNNSNSIFLARKFKVFFFVLGFQTLCLAAFFVEIHLFVTTFTLKIALVQNTKKLPRKKNQYQTKVSYRENTFMCSTGYHT